MLCASESVAPIWRGTNRRQHRARVDLRARAREGNSGMRITRKPLFRKSLESREWNRRNRPCHFPGRRGWEFMNETLWFASSTKSCMPGNRISKIFPKKLVLNREEMEYSTDWPFRWHDQRSRDLDEIPESISYLLYKWNSNKILSFELQEQNKASVLVMGNLHYRVELE